MKTSKPISTISYNTERFLAEKIYYWKKQGLIEYGMWIKHEPDVDGKKEHFHVYLQPSKLIQTEFLVDDSIEIDTNWKPLDEKFLSVLSEDEQKKEIEAHEKKRYFKMNVFHSSKPDDWILYAIHDEKYLTQKNLSRNCHYEIGDIKATCDDTLNEMISQAYDKNNNKLEFRIIEAIKKEMTWSQIVGSGMIPIRQMAGARLYYMALTGQDKNIL